ncbi:MAG: hypothetical protein LLG04_14815 [Parachlamydia sp.]|nr:hypothetical protein [Parachlamydia sp.]
MFGRPGVKEKILHEIRMFIFLTIYLVLFLNSLTIFRNLVLNEQILSYFYFGKNLIEAAILAKIILLGIMLKLGERYAEKPLIIPVLFKAAIFSCFVFVFDLLEHFVIGFFKGEKAVTVWKDFANHGLNMHLGKLAITFLFFILLFSLLEIARVIGEQKFIRLFTHGSNSIQE